jgi:hypothetical protein
VGRVLAAPSTEQMLGHTVPVVAADHLLVQAQMTAALVLVE